jgi:hypothetical protein
MTETVVTLTIAEILEASLAGAMRHVENLRDKRRLTSHSKPSGNDWQTHIEGACAERALAKHLNQYWSGKGDWKDSDLQSGVDCRHSQSGASLILHDNDPDERTFYFLTGFNGVYIIHGSIKAADGKRQEFWRDPGTNRPAYFVPKEALQRP